MKISDIIDMYIDKEARLLQGECLAAEARAALQSKAVLLILDELSEELLTLAGNGLPKRGRRRLLKRLGIPRDKAE